MEVKNLTAEILEKNGFKKFLAGQYILPNFAMHENQHVNIAPMTEQINSDGKVWLLSIKSIKDDVYTDTRIAVSHVHELQRALTFCGVYKKIEV